MHLVGFVIRICRDARSPERQIVRSYTQLSDNYENMEVTRVRSGTCANMF